MGRLRYTLRAVLGLLLMTSLTSASRSSVGSSAGFPDATIRTNGQPYLFDISPDGQDGMLLHLVRPSLWRSPGSLWSEAVLSVAFYRDGGPGGCKLDLEVVRDEDAEPVSESPESSEASLGGGLASALSYLANCIWAPPPRLKHGQQSLQLYTSPVGCELKMLLRCLSPTSKPAFPLPWTGPPLTSSASPATAHVIVRADLRPNTAGYGMACLLALSLMLASPFIARSPLTYYALGLLVSAAGIVFALLWMLSRIPRLFPSIGGQRRDPSRDRGSSRAVYISVLAAASATAPLLVSRLKKLDGRTALYDMFWPLSELVPPLSEHHWSQGLTILTWLIFVCTSMACIAAGFYVVRTQLLDTSSPYSTLAGTPYPGAVFFVSTALRTAAISLLFWAGTADPIASTILAAAAAFAFSSPAAALVRAALRGAARMLRASSRRRRALRARASTAAAAAAATLASVTPSLLNSRTGAAATDPDTPVAQARPSPSGSLGAGLAGSLRRVASSVSGSLGAGGSPRSLGRPWAPDISSADPSPELPPNPSSPVQQRMAAWRMQRAAARARGEDEPLFSGHDLTPLPVGGGVLGSLEKHFQSAEVGWWLAAHAARLRVADAEGAIEEEEEEEEEGEEVNGR